MTANKKTDAPRAIVLSGVSKAFDGVSVLKDLSITIPSPGVTALMGRSGSGKTTLCSLLLGLQKPDAGRIDNPFCEISCAFQDPRLVPWLTATENVSLVLSGISDTEKKRLSIEMLTSLGLGDALDKLPSELSGGMQQRVSLARAFVAPHDFLILDEPFRGLDDKNKVVVIDLIREEAEKHPVLLVTHDKSDVEALGAVTVTLG